ncbi:MAG: cytochrome c oxidase accessory protein CcoG, partial [Flavobacteriales bacterium]|nr:cytochrome c oxidase accessory protein CcoG [Flavobacteriales bacterium]
TPGMLFQERPDGRISNLYTVKTVNKTPYDLPLRFELLNVKGEIEMVGRQLDLKGGELAKGEFFIILPPDQLSSMKTKVVIGVFSGNELLEEVKTSFLGPIKRVS